MRIITDGWAAYNIPEYAEYKLFVVVYQEETKFQRFAQNPCGCFLKLRSLDRLAWI